MRTLENHYSTIVLLDRDDISTTLMEIFLRHAGYAGKVIKLSSVEQANSCLDETKAPVLLITDFFTNYIDNFSFFDKYHQKADRVIMVGEFEEEISRFTKKYSDILFYKKPHTIEEVRSWLNHVDL